MQEQRSGGATVVQRVRHMLVSVPFVFNMCLAVALGGVIVSLLSQINQVGVIRRAVSNEGGRAVALAEARIAEVKSAASAVTRRRLACAEQYGHIQGNPGYRRTTWISDRAEGTQVTVAVWWGRDRNSIRLEAILGK